MEKKSKKKVMAIVAALVIVILVSVQGIILLLQKRQAGSQELSKVANAESDEMLADASTERKVLSSKEKQEFMENLSKKWDGNTVNTVEVKIGGNNTSESNEVSSEGSDEAEKMKVPVPLGYTASQVQGEDTVNGGFVIYEGDGQVTGDSNDENVKEAKKTRNQWVWVPIYDVNEIYGTDSSGHMHGKLYEYPQEGESKRKPFNWSEDANGAMTISSPTNFREPDLVTGFDRDDYLPDKLFEEETEELEKELMSNFEKTISSIKKYGGFYIGRYETGGLSGEAKVVKQNEDISNQQWYTMYEKSKALKGKNRNVETSMIWGCLWDATTQWLIDTEAATYSDVANSSASWGNFYREGFTYENSQGQIVEKKSNSYIRIPTGSSDRNKKNNIFDMAGNVDDMTLEACGVADDFACRPSLSWEQLQRRRQLRANGVQTQPHHADLQRRQLTARGQHFS